MQLKKNIPMVESAWCWKPLKWENEKINALRIEMCAPPEQKYEEIWHLKFSSGCNVRLWVNSTEFIL